MLARSVVFILALTALAPIALLWAIKLLSSGNGVSSQTAKVLLCGTALLVVFALLVFFYLIPKHSARQVLIVQKSEAVDKDVLSFLLAYMLPLVQQTDKPINWWVVVSVGVMIFLVIVQAQLIHVNPLLTFFGFHFFKVSAASGQTHLLITRSTSVVPSELTAFRLSEHLWYEEHRK